MHIVETPSKNTWMEDMRQSTAQRSMYERYVAETKENAEQFSRYRQSGSFVKDSAKFSRDDPIQSPEELRRKYS